jgi:acyl dehydratase
MSEEAAAAADDAGEPAADDRPPFDPLGDSLELPAVGDPVAELRCGASRSDLMRYAAASDDWNPIHLDHDAARAAGLEGVIVHGLLMASWIGRLASRYGTMDAMSLRFRNPLRPAIPAVVTGSTASVVGKTAELNLALSAGDRRLVTAVVAVTA